MNISTDMVPGGGADMRSIGAAGAVPPPMGIDASGREELAPADKLELSNAGQMIGVGLGLARGGSAEVQAFMSQLEDGLRAGEVDADALLALAPEELTTAMESQGIDLEEALQTISEHADIMPPPPSGQVLEDGALTSEGAEEAAEAHGAGKAQGGGGARAESSEEEDNAVEALEEQISELQQEIGALQGKEQTEDVESELSAKQTELSMAQAELAALQSEAEDG